MTNELLNYLRCPFSRTALTLKTITGSHKYYDGEKIEIIWEGILYAEQDWFYPVIHGIPRLTVEAFLDYNQFLEKRMPDYQERKNNLISRHGQTIALISNKNSHIKKSFGQEWRNFNYEIDKTWKADKEGLIKIFLNETDETVDSLKGKLILDAGCGNGLLDQFIAELGSTVIGMDVSMSIEKAFEKNSFRNAHFIQGDVQFPPVPFELFDIVHSSGVLIHTNNSELTFSCISPCVKPNGKLSVWLYHHRQDLIHNTFNFMRRYTSRLPLKFQYYLYLFTLYPISYIVKRLKGNKQNKRELMLDLLDWFSPKYRREHYHDEVNTWFSKRNYKNIKVTTNELFGFNTTGVKNPGSVS